MTPSNKGVADVDAPAQPTEIRPCESMDCYMQRSGNSTGNMDDKTDYPPDKIVTADIPLTIDAQVGPTPNGLQFELTPGSKATNLVWSISPTISGITMSGSGLLKGQFPAETLDTRIELLVSVKGDVEGETKTIDERTFVISPSKGNKPDVISFTHPLPGGVVTSRFGPRRPPATGASSQHGGADFAMPNRSTIDVLSAADGTVEFTGYQARGAGNYIKVKHFNAENKHLCTTVYMHLAKIYVSAGQKVIKGQKIGHEGNTGVGTGAHLHFECRLPNGTKIDPLPLINGDTTMFKETNPDNTGKAGTDYTQKSEAVLTNSNVEARQQPCPENGPDYPKDPDLKDAAPIPPADISDPYKYAWNFIMKHEVGPWWDPSGPETDPEIADGLIDTAAQKRKVGFVNHKNDRGGPTKFGVAQNFNPSVNVRTMKYSQAEAIGFNNYWSKGSVVPKNLAGTKPKTAGMLFDMNYINGAGGASSIYRKAGITDSMSDGEALQRLYEARKQHFYSLAESRPANKTFLKGWLKRADESYSYFRSYTA